MNPVSTSMRMYLTSIAAAGLCLLSSRGQGTDMPDNKPRMTAAEMTERAYHFFLDAKGLSPRAGQVDMMAFCSAVVNATPLRSSIASGLLRPVRGQGKHSGIVCR